MNVLIETMIITATRAAIGICFTQSPSTTIRNSRKAPAKKVESRVRGAGGDVDHRLADHRAAAHSAQEAGDEVGDALADAFPVLVAAGVRHVVDDRER